MKKVLAHLVLAAMSLALLAVPQVHAAVILLANGALTGSSAGSYTDLSGLTSVLENGVSANLLGGMGSGLAYAGADTFIAVPDRGPNAVSYDSLVDDTVSYIERFHTVSMSLTPNTSSGLPFLLTPILESTTLLYSPIRLAYGTGDGLVSAQVFLRKTAIPSSTLRAAQIILIQRTTLATPTMPGLMRKAYGYQQTVAACSSPTSTGHTSTNSIGQGQTPQGVHLATASVRRQICFQPEQPKSRGNTRVGLPTKAWKALRSRPTARRWSALCKTRCFKMPPKEAMRAGSAHRHDRRRQRNCYTRVRLSADRPVRASVRSLQSTATSSWSTNATARAWATAGRRRTSNLQDRPRRRRRRDQLDGADRGGACRQQDAFPGYGRVADR